MLRQFFAALDQRMESRALALRSEVGEQLRDYRRIAYLVAAQAEAASDVLQRRPAEHGQAVVEAVRAQLGNSEPYPPSFIAQIRMRNP
jgi:hypothetical protein